MADVVIVGGGPVGLWTAIQIKKRSPETDVQVYERYDEYKRSHVLRLEKFSMLLYGKSNSKNPHEKAFFEEVTGKKLGKLTKAFQRAVGTVLVRTHDLEKALKNYASALGVQVSYEKMEGPEAVMEKHPEATTFIAADGAKSGMREALLGEKAIKHYPLQYVVEVKYQAKGRAEQLEFFGDHYKANKLMSGKVFEYVGREKDGETPVTLRFFIDKQTYDGLPEAGFKDPMKLSDERLPAKLAEDIRTYMNIRAAKAGENYKEGSAKLSKLTLSMYAASSYSVRGEKGRNWYFVGDAAMGVPYFRALNAGLISGSLLAFVVTRKLLSPANRARAYNAFRPLSVAWEFTAARGKNLALKAYEAFHRVNKASPLEMVKWSDQEAQDFRATSHRAFRPGDDPRP